MCERCGRRPPSEAHHRWLRSQGGPDDPANLAALCVFCHKWCHANPAAAVEEGWIVQAPHDYAGTELVLAGGMRCLLDAHYGYVITGWEDPPARDVA